MESKAQKAALAGIEELKKRLKEHGIYYTNPCTAVRYNILEKTDEVIKEYGLQNRSDVIESIYNVLIEIGCYTDAASFAKKYGL